MKRKFLASALTAVLTLSVALTGCGGGDTSDNASNNSTGETTQAVAENETEQGEDVSSETISNEEAEINSEPEVEHRVGETIIGISDKDIAELSPIFHSSVRNDVTGNWRLAMIAENVDIEEYVLSYYQNYFKDDTEIHAIINMTRKITTNIACYGNMLFVTHYEYVDGEEHDADKLFSGLCLDQLIVYTDNGDIEEIIEEELE